MEYLAIDLGNCFTNIAARNKKGEIKVDNFRSTYDTPTNVIFNNENAVEIGGKIVQFGLSGGSQLAQDDKTKRKHFAHQLLLAVFKTLGAGSHHVKVAVGLPISDYVSANDKKGKLLKEIEKLNTVTGTVEGQVITVNVIDPPLVCSEAYHTLGILWDKGIIPKTKRTLIADIGMKTTDYLTLEYDKVADTIKAIKYNSIPKGLDYIYEPVVKELSDKGHSTTSAELDAYYIDQETITVEKEDGTYEEFSVVDEVMKQGDKCDQIITDIELEIKDKLINYHKIFIGGGAKVIVDVSDAGKLPHVIEVDLETQYYANALGFLDALYTA